jgi:hypothetical protein
MHSAAIFDRTRLGRRIGFFQKIGEFNFHVGGLGLEPTLHLAQDIMKILQVDLAMKTVENFHKAAHMSPLKLMGQIDIHINRRDSFLRGIRLVEYGNRVGYILDPDFSDVNLAEVGLILYVLHPGSAKMPLDSRF